MNGLTLSAALGVGTTIGGIIAQQLRSSGGSSDAICDDDQNSTACSQKLGLPNAFTSWNDTISSTTTPNASVSGMDLQSIIRVAILVLSAILNLTTLLHVYGPARTVCYLSHSSLDAYAGFLKALTRATAFIPIATIYLLLSPTLRLLNYRPHADSHDLRQTVKQHGQLLTKLSGLLDQLVILTQLPEAVDGLLHKIETSFRDISLLRHDLCAAVRRVGTLENNASAAATRHGIANDTMHGRINEVWDALGHAEAHTSDLAKSTYRRTDELERGLEDCRAYNALLEQKLRVRDEVIKELSWALSQKAPPR